MGVGWPWNAINWNFWRISQIWEATTAKRMKIGPHCQRQRCNPLNVLLKYFFARRLYTVTAVPGEADSGLGGSAGEVRVKCIRDWELSDVGAIKWLLWWCVSYRLRCLTSHAVTTENICSPLEVRTSPSTCGESTLRTSACVHHCSSVAQHVIVSFIIKDNCQAVSVNSGFSVINNSVTWAPRLALL